MAVLLGGVAVLMAAGLGYRMWAAGVFPSTTWSAWFNPLAKLDVFAIGLLLAVVAAAGVKITWKMARWGMLLMAAGFVALTIVVRPEGGQTSVFQHSLAGVACALILASSTLAPRQPRWLASRAVAFLGTISYGIYLWQEPVQRALAAVGLLPPKQAGPMFLLTAAIVFVTTLVVAWMSFHVIEKSALSVLASLDAHGRMREYYTELQPPPQPVVPTR